MASYWPPPWTFDIQRIEGGIVYVSREIQPDLIPPERFIRVTTIFHHHHTWPQHALNGIIGRQHQIHYEALPPHQERCSLLVLFIPQVISQIHSTIIFHYQVNSKMIKHLLRIYIDQVCLWTHHHKRKLPIYGNINFYPTGNVQSSYSCIKHHPNTLYYFSHRKDGSQYEDHYFRYVPPGD